MVQFQPFAGWRYDMSQVGSLGDVICSVPEEILLCADNEKLVDDLYRLHPCNAVRLVLNRGEPGDQTAADRIARIVDFFELWKREEILFQEHDAAFYVIEQSSIHHPELPACVSVVGRVCCEDLSHAAGANSEVLPQGFSEQDAVLTARTQFSPVQAVVTEHESDVEVGELFHSIVPKLHGLTPIEIHEEAGQRLRVWVVTDRKLVDEIRQRLVSAQIAIVAGYEMLAAVIRAQQGRSDHREKFAMVWLTDMSDPGLTLLPSVGVIPCRAVQSGNSASPFEQIASRLMAACRVELVGDESFAPADAMELAEIHEHQPACCLGIMGGQWALISFRNQVPTDAAGFSIENAQSDLVRHIAEVLTETAGSSVVLQPLVNPQVATKTDTVAKLLTRYLAAAGEGSVVIAMPDSLQVLREGHFPSDTAESGVQRQRASIPAGRAGVVYYSVDE